MVLPHLLLLSVLADGEVPPTGLGIINELAKLSAAGVTGVLIAGIWGLLKGYIVPGWLYNQVVARADKWEQRYFESLVINKEALGHATKLVEDVVKKDP